jgi:RNA polymerase sigma-70 factor (ECF subfamily)
VSQAESLRNEHPAPDVSTTASDVSDNEVPDSERVLASKATLGDRKAYGALYERYVDKIYKYIYYKVGDRAEAEDLTSQTFLKAWDAIADYEWRNYPFGAWLFRIAHNLVVDHHRSRRESVSLDDGTPQLEHRATRYDIRPEKVLAQYLAEGRIRQAVDRLTEEQQQVLILRFFEGLDTGEVAELMNKRRGAIRGLQFRALSALRDLLEREQDELI